MEFKNISLQIESKLYKTFLLSLQLSGESPDSAIEKCLRWYISNIFTKTSKEYSPTEEHQEKKSFYGTGIKRIAKWALNTNQYNHKIIKAFFLAESSSSEVTLSQLEKICSDSTNKELYVPTFKNNYAQMKFDGPKSHGKIFEDDGNRVWIWEDAKETLLKYKKHFLVKQK